MDSGSSLTKNLSGNESKSQLSIPLFKNATFEPILEKPLTQIFKKTFYGRGWNVQGGSDKSGMILFGRIAHFGRSPIALNSVGAAREYRVTIGMNVRILHEKMEEALVSKTVEGRADYIARPDAQEDRIAKDRAIREAGRSMAEEVASLLQMIVDQQRQVLRE